MFVHSVDRCCRDWRKNEHNYSQTIFTGLGKPLLAHTIDVFEKSPLIDEIIVVINKNHEKQFRDQVLTNIHAKKALRFVFGGNTRQDSVYAGLELIFNRPNDYVLIHDGVRPLVSDEILKRSVEDVVKYGAVCCAIPSVDTLKVSKNNNCIESTLDRSMVWRAQTPQSFKISIIWEAIQKPKLTVFVRLMIQPWLSGWEFQFTW